MFVEESLRIKDLVHLADPVRGARSVGSLLAPGATPVASTPASYRRVRDPIDNGMRPAPGFVEQGRYRLPRLRWHVSCVVLRRSGDDR